MEVLESLGINWQMLLGQIINFLIVLFLLKKFAYQPFLNTLKKRKQRIKEGVDKAKEADKKMEKVEEERNSVLQNAHEKANEIVEQGKQRKKKVADNIEREAQEEKERILETAEREKKAMIERERKKQQKELVNMVSLVSKKVLGKKIDKDKDKELIEEALNNISSSNNK